MCWKVAISSISCHEFNSKFYLPIKFYDHKLIALQALVVHPVSSHLVRHLSSDCRTVLETLNVLNVLLVPIRSHAVPCYLNFQSQLCLIMFQVVSLLFLGKFLLLRRPSHWNLWSIMAHSWEIWFEIQFEIRLSEDSCRLLGNTALRWSVTDQCLISTLQQRNAFSLKALGRLAGTWLVCTLVDSGDLSLCYLQPSAVLEECSKNTSKASKPLFEALSSKY